MHYRVSTSRYYAGLIEKFDSSIKIDIPNKTEYSQQADATIDVVNLFLESYGWVKLMGGAALTAIGARVGNDIYKQIKGITETVINRNKAHGNTESVEIVIQPAPEKNTCADLNQIVIRCEIPAYEGQGGRKFICPTLTPAMNVLEHAVLPIIRCAQDKYTLYTVSAEIDLSSSSRVPSWYLLLQGTGLKLETYLSIEG